MTRLISVVLAMMLVGGLAGFSRADDAQDNKAILDKAIKALGGEEQLSKVKAVSWKIKGKVTFGGNENEFTSETVVQGPDHFRQVFEGEFGGNKVRGVTLLDGEKGSRAFGENRTEMDKDALADTKRTIYLTMIPVTLVSLKEKEFKLEKVADEMVEGKPAVGIKVTAPDNKDFKLYFDKENGLPVKMLAKVRGFMGGDFTQETTFSDYKELKEINKGSDKEKTDAAKAEKGLPEIKKATKIVLKRDGEVFMVQQITEFKILDKVEPKTFTEAL